MSRRRRKAYALAVCVLAAFLVWIDRATLDWRQAAAPASEEQTTARDFRRYNGKTFTVVHVVDGDTLDINCPDIDSPDTASRNKIRTRIRLWGVDTPEIAHGQTPTMYYGPEAAQFADRSVSGKRITVFLDQKNHTRDKYGRLLAYIQMPDGQSLNEALLTEGFAYADTRFKHSLFNKYRQLEASSRSLRNGLWKDVKSDQMPQWRQRKDQTPPPVDDADKDDPIADQ